MNKYEEGLAGVPKIPTHTPGPWAVADDFDKCGLIESDMGHVATISGYATPDDETMPNARLIAASPSLLRIARAYVELAEWAMGPYRSVTSPPDMPTLPDALADARAVIAAVEGGAA